MSYTISKFSSEIINFLALIGLIVVLFVVFCLFSNSNVGNKAIEAGKSVIYASYGQPAAKILLEQRLFDIERDKQQRRFALQEGPIVEELNSNGMYVKLEQSNDLKNQSKQQTLARRVRFSEMY